MKEFKLILVLGTLIILLFGRLILTSKQDDLSNKLEASLTTLMEASYFEGQVDALNNDVRVHLNKDSVYVWTSSPWNTNETPSYNPLLDSNNLNR